MEYTAVENSRGMLKYWVASTSYSIVPSTLQVKLLYGIVFKVLP